MDVTLDEKDAKAVTEALELAHTMMVRRDEMNAAIHMSVVRFSPLTDKLALATAIVANANRAAAQERRRG